MNDFMERITERAKKEPKTVVFPESDNVDILRTAEQVAVRGIGYPLLIGKKEDIEARASKHQISTKGFRYFNCKDENLAEKFSQDYTKQYSDFSKKAVLRRIKEELECAMLLLKTGYVDCVAAGKVYTTGNVLMEAMSILGFQEGIETISSLGIADIPGFDGPQGTMLGLADCAINAAPDAKQLSDIAIASADTVRSLLGWTPRVAMLSFSTCGSAEHVSLDTVRKAVDIVKEKRTDILIDGEFQLDAAILPKIAEKKVGRESEVAGRANVLVFPNLHAGNIGVKLIQIFGKANAYGPILQGFSRPVCDFSRSAPVEEMLGNVAMLVAQAGNN